jgi:hypothetical protein
MNILQIIQTLEELLYETITWLIFYPRTLWKCVTRPEALMAYTSEELRERPEERFTDLMSPPLFLLLSLLLAHGLEQALGLKPEELADSTGEMGRAIVTSEQNLLLFRTFLFALFPLVTAVGVLRRKKLALDRDALRGPFFQQCYFAAPYGLAVSSASALVRHPAEWTTWIGFVLLLVGTGWYLWVQARWVRRELDYGWGRALGLSAWLFLLASLAGSLLGFVILRS